MDRVWYIVIAIAIIVLLLGVFFWSFIAYRRAPLPKGCEELKPSEGKCGGCSEVMCPFYGKFNKEEDNHGS